MTARGVADEHDAPAAPRRRRDQPVLREADDRVRGGEELVAHASGQTAKGFRC